MSFDDLAKFGLALPPYLSTDAKRALLDQLGAYPNSSAYFGKVEDDELVQGDGWRSFPIFEMDWPRPRLVLGLVISNSCDLASANDPKPDQRVVFAPVLNLEAFRDRLQQNGYSRGDVESQLTQIRSQQISRIFYLPAVPGQFGESVVALDHLHSLPLRKMADVASTRVFSLSLYGWYVLLFKLSVHFTRTTEGVARKGLA